MSADWTALCYICDEIVAWQAPSGGISFETCEYHRETPFGRPCAFGQDLPWLCRTLYSAYDLLRAPAYKAAADRYAVYFIACMADHAPAYALGGAIDPCFTLYRQYNLLDTAFDGLYQNHSKIHSIYRWLLAYRTEDPNYLNAGYDWIDDEGRRRTGEDVGYSNDLSDVGRGLVGYFRFFGDSEALHHAEGLAHYFITEHEPGTMKGVWSSQLGTWLIGPRHTAGFENLTIHADEAGWGWSAYYVAHYLLRLYDVTRDDELRARIAERCLSSLRWTYDACQFDDGALGMQGRDDKWLGMTALAILQMVELVRRGLVDRRTLAEYLPRAQTALNWLRMYCLPNRFPRHGYIPVTVSSRPWPGWNTTWQIALAADGLMAGPELESYACIGVGD